MSFLAPGAFAGLALSAVVAALYFLRQRPQTQEVSALFLWPAVVARPRHSWRWQRAPLGLLLLQLAALVLLVGALARPALPLVGQSSGRTALIVDTSASMRMKTPAGTRFQEAIRRAHEEVRAGEWTLIEARRGGGVRLPLTADLGLVREALAALEPTFLGDPPPERVVAWLRGQAPWETFDRVIWLSDHVPRDEALQGLGITFVTFPAGVGNAAISAFALRAQPDPALGYEAFVAVRNDAAETLFTELILEAPEREVPLLRTPIEVPAGRERRYAFSLAGEPPEQAWARIAVQDGLDFDNVRAFALRPAVRSRAFWIGQPDLFLAQALRATGVSTILPWTPQAFPAITDLLVAVGADLPAEARGHALLVDAGRPSALARGDLVPVDAVWARDLSHPLLNGLRPEDWAVLRARSLDLPAGSETLLVGKGPRGRSLPLVGTSQVEGERLAWLAFPLEASNVHLTVDFPILIARLVAWLLGSLPREAALAETGTALPLVDEVTWVQPPDGPAVRVEGGAFLDTERPGFYALPGRGWAWAVNVPLEESLPLPAGAPPSATGASRTISAVQPRPLWPLLGWLGLLLLALEWLAYERPRRSRA